MHQRALPRMAYVSSPTKNNEANNTLEIFIDAAMLAPVREGTAPRAEINANTIIHPSIVFSLAVDLEYCNSNATANSFAFSVGENQTRQNLPPAHAFFASGNKAAYDVLWRTEPGICLNVYSVDREIPGVGRRSLVSTRTITPFRQPESFLRGTASITGAS
jgi:hypothetical protein